MQDTTGLIIIPNMHVNSNIRYRVIIENQYYIGM